MKRFWSDGFLGVEDRSVGIALANGHCYLVGDGGGGGITLTEGLHDWERRAVALLNYTLAFALQRRKSMENLSQGSRVAPTWLSFQGQPRMAC
jgi:hypothetical protein